MNYWENRYKNGGNSGAGSYGQLAKWKGQIVSNFIREKNIKSIIDFGCGDGNQLKYIEIPKWCTYVGVDISETAIEICKQKHPFYEYYTKNMTHKYFRFAELVISLDVIFHLTTKNDFTDYMDDLTDASERYIIIYSSNGDKLENPASHLKDNRFTDYMEKTEFELIRKIENKFPYDPNNTINTSISDFYIYQKRINN